MLSPFPGMDPYLEDRRWWEVFHSRFIAGMMDALNENLSPKYVASSEQRLYVEEPQRFIRPNVAVIAVPVREPEGAVAVADERATAVEECWEIEPEALQIIERFIEIITVGDESKVIAIIELLSPNNKAHGSAGRAEYLKKQQEVLASDTHLVEIDLLKEGEPTIAVPPSVLIQHGRYDYLACLTPGRSVSRRVQSVWPIQLRKKLPTIRITLGPDEPPVLLNLQAVFDEVYSKAAFNRRINYGVDPVIPLTEADADFVQRVLTEKQLRV